MKKVYVDMIGLGGGDIQLSHREDCTDVLDLGKKAEFLYMSMSLNRYAVTYIIH